MKKRIFILALCLCLLVSTAPMSASASSGVNFIAINDTLPPELVNSHITYGGVVYVPYWIFTNAGFGIYYSFLADNNTAHLYSDTSQLFFEISSGLTYDGSGNYYSLPGIMWGGTVYVPLSYICSFFGSFSYSFISGTYGTVLRLTDDRVVLSDTEFARAASSLMKQYYDSYTDNSTGINDIPGRNDNDDDHEGTDVLLSFLGLPGDELLGVLKRYDVEACFFVTAGLVRSDPDRVRRVVGEGHSLGVLCTADALAEYQETAALIFEASRVRTILVTALDDYAIECSQTAAENSLAFCRIGMNAVHSPEDDFSPYAVTSVLDASDEGTSLFLSAAEGMEETAAIILNYLTDNKFDILPPSETVN